MSLKLDKQIRNLSHGDHVCMIYENAAEQMAALVPFIQAGLEQNDLCVYIVDGEDCREVAEALEAGGIAVAREGAAGRLLLLTQREVYLKHGRFDPETVIAFLEEKTKEAVAAGFRGLRITGEMSWAQGEESGCERLIEYEARLNCFFPGQRVVAICQYHRRRFPAEAIRDVLRTHPVAVLGSQVCPNLFYEPPELILEQQGEDFRVDWMIRQLKQTRASEQALQEVNSLLETANARKDEFLAMLGHELRNPLAAISNGIALLGLGTLDQEGAARVQKTIEHQMKNITRLVDDLLDVARVTRGKISLNRAPVDLIKVVRSAVHFLEGEILAQRHEVNLNLPEDAVFVEGDETRLEQIVSNVLQNAVRYTPPGGSISVNLDADGQQATLRVTDNGIGMPPELLRNAFELFAQGERGLSRKEGGLGIGLTLARTLTELHNGAIEAKSAGPGQGTTVLIRLPVLEDARSEVSAPAPASKISNLHVLLVEDNEAVAQTLAMLIEQLGQRVTVAPDGETALDQARALAPDLVLLDIGLPGINGYDVCKRLRALYGNEIPIVALTGYGASDRSREARFSEYCTKPLSLNALLHLINDVQQQNLQRKGRRADSTTH